MGLRKLFVCLVIICYRSYCDAQENWQSPELEQMYHNVQQYEERGNNKDAIITLRQLIALVPPRVDLSFELARLYYVTGDYTHAETTLSPLFEKESVTEATYQLLASTQQALGHLNSARSTVSKGIRAYPHSGILYYRKGLLYKAENDKRKAVDAWVTGVRFQPSEPLNYAEIARAYLGTGDNVWGIIYAEMYIGMRKDTLGNDELKTMLLEGWKYYFTTLADESYQAPKSELEREFNNIYKQLTPVVSDGISTENLTMVRTRYVQSWQRKHIESFANALFEYHKNLLCEGWFDIYNEWLFGKAEHQGQFDAWNKFHEGDMKRFMEWRAEHLLKP